MSDQHQPTPPCPPTTTTTIAPAPTTTTTTVAATSTTTEPTTTTVVVDIGTPVVPPACQEDEACWDCTTMGNHICGPTQPPFAAPVIDFPDLTPNAPVVYIGPGLIIEPAPASAETSIATAGVHLPTTGFPVGSVSLVALACVIAGTRIWRWSVRR